MKYRRSMVLGSTLAVFVCGALVVASLSDGRIGGEQAILSSSGPPGTPPSDGPLGAPPRSDSAPSSPPYTVDTRLQRPQARMLATNIEEATTFDQFLYFDDGSYLMWNDAGSVAYAMFEGAGTGEVHCREQAQLACADSGGVKSVTYTEHWVPHWGPNGELAWELISTCSYECHELTTN